MKRSDERFERLFNELRESREESNRRFEEMREESNRRFEAIDRRFEAMERRFEAMREESERRFETIDRRFEAMERRFDNLEDWVGIVVGGFQRRAGRKTRRCNRGNFAPRLEEGHKTREYNDAVSYTHLTLPTKRIV